MSETAPKKKGGRPATGSVDWSESHGCWVVRVTMPDGSRQPVKMPGIPKEERERALYLGKVTSKRVRQLGAVPEAARETVNEYAARWLEARAGRVASVRDNKGHLTTHILPVLGTVEMAKVKREDIERVVGALDAKVRAGDISAKTAGNAWGTLSKLFDDATNAKPAEGLRCLQSDPTSGVRGPDDNDADKLLQFLYPSEFLAFVSCEDVPLAWRRNVAIAVYLCLRDGEQRALKWPNVDLEHGVITVAERFDRRTNEDRDGTKGGAARQIPIHPHLLPLLEAMHEESGGTGYVCDMPSLRDMARGLRRWLRRAGVEREALHYGNTVSKALRWHDCRATGLTWLALENRSASEIRDIAGHTQTAMTDRYVRSAGVLRGGRFGLPFPTLPTALLESSEVLAEKRQNPPVLAEGFPDTAIISTTSWRGGRDSKTAETLGKSTGQIGHDPGNMAADVIVSGESGAPNSGGNTPALADSDPIEGALARALDAATAAGQWAMVAEIVSAIQARRQRSGAGLVAPRSKTRPRGA